MLCFNCGVVQARRYNTTNNAYYPTIFVILITCLIIMTSDLINNYIVKSIYCALFASCHLLIFAIVQFIVFQHPLDIALTVVFSVMLIIFAVVLCALYYNHYYKDIINYIELYIYGSIILFLLYVCVWYYAYNIIISIILIVINVLALVVWFYWLFIRLRRDYIFQYGAVILIEIYLSVLLLFHFLSNNNYQLQFNNIELEFETAVKDLDQYIVQISTNSVDEVLKYLDYFQSFLNNTRNYSQEDLAAYWYNNYIQPLVDAMSNNQNRNNMNIKLQKYQNFYNTLLNLNTDQFQNIKLYLDNFVTKTLYKNQEYQYYDSVFQQQDPLSLYNYLITDYSNNNINYYQLLQSSFPMPLNNIINYDVYIKYINSPYLRNNKITFNNYSLLTSLKHFPKQITWPPSMTLKEYTFNGNRITICFYNHRWYIRIIDNFRNQIIIQDHNNNKSVYHKNDQNTYDLTLLKSSDDLVYHIVQPKNFHIESTHNDLTHYIKYNNPFWNYNNSDYNSLVCITDLRNNYNYLYGNHIPSSSNGNVLTHSQDVHTVYRLINHFAFPVNLAYSNNQNVYNYINQAKQQYGNGYMQYFLTFNADTIDTSYGYNNNNVWSFVCDNQFNLRLIKHYESGVSEIVNKNNS